MINVALAQDRLNYSQLKEDRINIIVSYSQCKFQYVLFSSHVKRQKKTTDNTHTQLLLCYEKYVPICHKKLHYYTFR